MDELFQIATLPGLAHTIQLALAPVFLLNGIGAVLGILTGRLSRIVDRARAIEERITSAEHPRHAAQVNELRLIDRRMRVVNTAIFLVTASAVAVALVVAVMFIARLAGFGFARTLAVVFTAAMFLLIAGLVLFLVEVRMAVAAIQVKDELLERR